MPSNPPVVKKEAVNGYGTVIGGLYQTGHPEGTGSYELMDQEKTLDYPLDIVIAPVGGGRMKGLKSDTLVFRTKPECASDAQKSFHPSIQMDDSPRWAILRSP